MALHRLTSVTMGVPNVEETAAYYADFGLQGRPRRLRPRRPGSVPATAAASCASCPPRPRLVDLHVGVAADDLDRAAGNLRAGSVERGPGWISAGRRRPDPGLLEIAERLTQDTVAATPYNRPGRTERPSNRAPGILRDGPVAPRKLGHAVLGSTDPQATEAFFVSGLGFKISDRIKGAGGSCAAPPTTTTCWSWARRSRSCTTRRGRSTTWTRSAAARTPCSRTTPSGTSGASAGTTAGPTSSGTSRTRGQLQRVLQRHGLHRRRPALDARGPRGRPGPVRLGPAPAAVVHSSDDLAAMMTGARSPLAEPAALETAEQK